MKNITEIFVELGRRMRDFGSDERSARCIADAVAANEWFTAADVKTAANAVRDEFLDESKLKDWLSKYDLSATEPCSVAIIMAGNIPFVGMFDMMCALSCGHDVWIKPSRKDSATIEYIVDTLRDICSDIPLRRYNDDARADLVIATGGENAAKYFRNRFSDVPALIRGSRHSVAVLAGDETDEELQGLKKDIFTYFGLGCRNVSLVFAPRNHPIDIEGPDAITPMYRDNYVYTKAMMTMNGMPFTDRGTYVAAEAEGFSDSLSKVNFRRYDDLAEVEEWLRVHDEEIQCVVTRCLAHPRRAEFGRAQYPALSDYADGIDVMEFLKARKI